MQIFIMNSFSDNQTVKESLTDSLIKYKDIKYNKLNQKYNPFWKCFFKYYLDKSDLIILFIGKDTYNSKNIAWELQEAKKKQKKIYAIKLANNHNLPANYIYDSIGIDLNITLKKIKDDTQTELSNILLNNYDESSIEEKKILLEEYKLMVQSSESLIARRQTTNTFFFTFNGSLLSLLGVIITKINNYIILIIPIVGIILCYHWHKLIVSYGQLNSGKFSVITNLETFLPASIFFAEWHSLGEGKNPHKYTSFTMLEKYLPLTLMSIYIIFILVYLCYIFFFNEH